MVRMRVLTEKQFEEIKDFAKGVKIKPKFPYCRTYDQYLKKMKID
jgi:hypothetical protein